MPIPMTAKLPKPRSAEEFEDMTTDALRRRWKDPHAARHGRSGQQQHGIDIIGRPHWLNGRLGVAQCKNTDRVTLTAVLAEVRAAMLFPGEIGEFLFCTTADRDAVLQNEVRGHFEANPAPFRVEMVFWLDILGDLAGDTDLVVKYWGLQAHPTTRDTLVKLETELREAFERAERLNAGLHNGFWEQHIDYDFRPDRVERFYDAVSDAVAEREFLVSNVKNLIAAMAAANRALSRLRGTIEVCRTHQDVLDASRPLRDVLRSVMNDAHHGRQQVLLLLTEGTATPTRRPAS